MRAMVLFVQCIVWCLCEQLGWQVGADSCVYQDYGALVELQSGATGWLHISELCNERVANMSDKLSVGEEMEVICIGKDVKGNAKLSRKALLKK
mmetsp:Transcript_967/g.2241  ORF Transcript_967/g.2241 Transcript_967/m.2241 type:complete len:94 (+) Transcript_967:60-341(+)